MFAYLHVNLCMYILVSAYVQICIYVYIIIIIIMVIFKCYFSGEHIALSLIKTTMV